MVDNGVLSETECRSRYEIYLEKYIKTIRIEALTLLDMVQKDILPAIAGYAAELRRYAEGTETAGSYEYETAAELSELSRRIFRDVRALQELLDEKPGPDSLRTAFTCRDSILPRMAAIRASVDRAETITDRNRWPFPTYRELLFGVD